MRRLLGRALMVVPALVVTALLLTACGPVEIDPAEEGTVRVYSGYGIRNSESSICVKDADRWICEPTENGTRFEVRVMEE